MDKLAEFLSTDHSGPQVGTETLELLGKQAAAAFLERGTHPTTSILKLAEENSSLTSEHLRRVCEFANTSLYLNHHEKSKTAGSSSSYPQFPLADADAVIGTLTKRASNEIEQKVDSSYLAAPRKSRLTTQREEKEAYLDELFDTYEKTASANPDFTTETALNDLTATKDQLKGIRDSLKAIQAEHDFTLKTAGDRYFDAVKDHLLEGGTFSDVLVAARSTAVDDAKLAEAIQPLVERIMVQKVASANALQAAVRGMDKLAHRVVNPDHPFVTLFNTIIESNDLVEKLASDLRDVEEDLSSVNEIIRRNVRAFPSL